MIKYGKPVDCVLAITPATVSAACDLGIPCEYVNIVIPTLSPTATIALQVSVDGTTYQALGIGSAAVTATTTGDVTTTLELGGYQFLKIVVGTAQAAARTFTLRGYRG
ncbi:MAG: hypothetical protein IMZ61_06705 [Planctomycetes bacterium]|nr:hypothetical protein [Planctomycetota bacterium]